MINPFKEINWKPGKGELKNFAKSLMIGFTALGIIFYCVGLVKHGLPGNFKILLIPVCLGTAIFIISLPAPKLLIPIYYPWFFLSALVGIIISNLALLVFYYLFFSPFAILLRTFTGRDPLKLKSDCRKNSGWIDYTGNKDLKRYFRQY